MQIGEEEEAIEVPIPLHPGQRPATAPAPVPQPAEPERVPA
jgi:hypothetical protein